MIQLQEPLCSLLADSVLFELVFLILRHFFVLFFVIFLFLMVFLIEAVDEIVIGVFLCLIFAFGFEGLFFALLFVGSLIGKKELRVFDFVEGSID